MVDADVVVVGAGPVGSLVARQLARKGLSVLLLEEHKEVGRPVHCAGLIGINGLSNNGIIPRAEVILQRVHRSVFHAPSGAQVCFDKGEPHAFVLHRDRLDQQLAAEAEGAGAVLRLETRVLKVIRGSKEMRITYVKRGSKGELRTRFIVNAEGIGAQLMQRQNLPRPKKDFMLPALQYEVTNVSLQTDTVHLFFDSRFAKNFFSWIIPLDGHRARVGLATASRQPRVALDKFLMKCPLLAGAEIEKRYGGIVYTGGPSSRTIAKRFVNLGDAAGQTKATTGGGVVAGGACAVLAAVDITRALTNGHYNHRALQHYEQRWKRSLGRQLQLMARLRRLVNTLTNKELDQLFTVLQDPKIKEMVETRGDIDRQGALISAALTSPRFLRLGFSLIISKLPFLPQILLA